MSEKYIKEHEREIPVMEESDVIVCGGGPAGVMAALSAARQGARVQLLEVQGCVGGIWTAGLLSWILDIGGHNGLLKAMMEELTARGVGRVVNTRRYICDGEALKYLLEQWCDKAGVHIQYHTRVVSAVVEDNKTISHVITESKSGRQAWPAKIFIDATGDGDLGALAGCGFDIGRPGDRETQPMSLIATLAGLDVEQVDRFNRASLTESHWAKKNLLAEIRRAGIEPSYTDPFLAHIGEDRFIFMVNHIYGASAMDAGQMTEATIKARKQIQEVVQALKRLGEPWQNCYVAATAAHIGIREGRRIHGLYTVTEQDIIEGRQFPDSICTVGFGWDIHATNAEGTKGYQSQSQKASPYTIPLRSLIAVDVENMLMAGRCISGDFYAHSSYRVTGDAAAIGEAAGVLAALAAGNHMPPARVPYEEVQKILAKYEG